MKVLFIYFNREFRPRTLLSQSILESTLKNEGHKTALFDTSFYPEFADKCDFNTTGGAYRVVKNLKIKPKKSSAYSDLKKKVEEFKPDIVAFTYYETHTHIQRSLLKFFKTDFPNIKIIAGGPQPCINPEESLREPYIDMVCYGEGENVIKEVCSRLDCGEDISNIKGLWIKQGNGKIVKNGISLLTNLDTLSTPNWDSYDPIQIYGLFNGRAYRMGHVEFNRGCPFNCTYCGSGSIKKAYYDDGQMNYVRHKTPARAVKEYKELKEKYNLEMFYFIDGTFTAMPKRTLEKLAYLYRKEVNLPFIALVHPTTIDERTAELLSIMGCVHVSIGVESGVEEYRERVLDRKMSNKKIIEAITYLQKYGIHVSTYNMIGIPGMDRKHIFKTIRLSRLAKPDSAILSIFIPFPDNKLTNSLIKQGLIDPGKIKVSIGNVSTVEIKDMSKKEIEGLYNTFNLYIKFPEWTFPFIRLLEFSNPITNFIRSFLLKCVQHFSFSPTIKQIDSREISWVYEG